MIRPIKFAMALGVIAIAAATPAAAQFGRFQNDDRGNVEGKRASCEVYARLTQVQADANRQYRCDYRGPQWSRELDPHFRWCRFVKRSTLIEELRNRAADLQRCFDKLGDFDDDTWDRGRR